MEEEIEKYYQNQAKGIIDLMFDTKIFKESVTRDDMNGYEDLLAYMFQAQAKTARKMAEFEVKYNNN